LARTFFSDQPRRLHTVLTTSCQEPCYSIEEEPPEGGGRLLHLGLADHRGNDCACGASQYFQAPAARDLLPLGRCGISLGALSVPRGLDKGAVTSLLESGGGVTAEDEPVDCAVVRRSRLAEVAPPHAIPARLKS